MINPNATKYTKLHAKEPKIGNRMMFCDWHALLIGLRDRKRFRSDLQDQYQLKPSFDRLIVSDCGQIPGI